VNRVPTPDERLSAYLDGELGPAERAGVDDLLAASQEWRSALDELAWARDAVRDLPRREAPPGFWEGVRWERLVTAGPPARRRYPWRIGAGAVAAAAAVAVFAVPDESPTRPTPEPRTVTDRSAVRGAVSGERVADPGDDVLEEVADLVLGPFGW
jgi:anti-sigma factor RsiW